MIDQTILTVVSKELIAKETVEMKLRGTKAINLGKPGQFVHIKLGNQTNHLLRRPISIADVNRQENTLTIIFKIIGEGTELLSRFGVGDNIDVLLPCGSSYPIEKLSIQSALLIGGGIGVPPLYYLGKQLREMGIEVTAILGFQTKEHVFYADKFNELGKTIVVTDDGSMGQKGFVTNAIDRLEKSFDYFFSCGPTPMLHAVATKLQDQDGYISIEQRMGCGVGACYACVVPTKTGGFKKICKDGPVFRANEVILT